MKCAVTSRLERSADIPSGCFMVTSLLSKASAFPSCLPAAMERRMCCILPGCGRAILSSGPKSFRSVIFPFQVTSPNSAFERPVKIFHFIPLSQPMRKGGIPINPMSTFPPRIASRIAAVLPSFTHFIVASGSCSSMYPSVLAICSGA